MPHPDPDPDADHYEVTIDHGEIAIHHVSLTTRTILLGTAATRIAIDILRLSGQASATNVQHIADTLEARALADDPLGRAEMLAVAETLRRGVGVPVRTPVRSGVVVAFPGRVG